MLIQRAPSNSALFGGVCISVALFTILFAFIVSQIKSTNFGVWSEGETPFSSYVTPLEDVNLKAYLACRNLEANKFFSNKGTRYYVLTNPAPFMNDSFIRVYQAWTLPDKNGRIRNEIYYWPETLNNPYFEEITAHEMGHIERQTRNETSADKFALIIVGKERFITALKYMSPDPTSAALKYRLSELIGD